jgi:replication factor C small subunit
MNWNDKYRPARITDLVGNREELQQIEGMIIAGSLPHLLFHGPPGTGKSTIAEIVADRICGRDNLVEINASDERGIDMVRTVVKRVTKHVPLFGGMTVVFFDEADGLTRDAQELLRRPMETSRNTLFIFACNDVNRITAPIKSRCKKFEFRLCRQDVIDRLQAIADAEHLTVPAGVLEEIADRVRGLDGVMETYDLRDAVNELQAAAATWGRSSQIDSLVEQYLRGVEQA